MRGEKYRGKTCHNCNKRIRYVSNGACVHCAQERARERSTWMRLVGTPQLFKTRTHSKR